MEDCSFFKKQAEECRSRSRMSSDPVLQETLRALSDDCMAYANKMDASLADEIWFLSDDGWAVPGNQKAAERTWSAKHVLCFSLLLTVPSMATLAWILL
jgi:hypothetical protein